MIRKNATLTGIVFSIILAFAIFTGSYLWISYNATDSGVVLDSKYSDSYNEILVQQNKLNNTIGDIRDSFEAVTEPTSIYSVAFNGLKGLLSVVKLPIQFVGIAVSTYLNIGTLVELPSWVKVLIILSITTIIILVILALIKGEAKI